MLPPRSPQQWRLRGHIRPGTAWAWTTGRAATSCMHRRSGRPTLARSGEVGHGRTVQSAHVRARRGDRRWLTLALIGGAVVGPADAVARRGDAPLGTAGIARAVAPPSSPAAAPGSSRARPTWPCTATPAPAPSASSASRAPPPRSSAPRRWPPPTDRTPKRRVVPALEIIATIASRSAGGDGDYSAESSVAKLRPLVDAAGRAGTYVVLDLQPGRSTFLSQAKRYRELLLEPHVGLALDPEWRLKPGQRHLKQVGSVTASEINDVSAVAGRPHPRRRPAAEDAAAAPVPDVDDHQPVVAGHLPRRARAGDPDGRTGHPSPPSARPGGRCARAPPRGSCSAGRTSSTRTARCSAPRPPWRSAPEPRWVSFQ